MSERVDLDLDQLLLMTGGDADLAEEVLDIFRQQAEIWARLLDPRAPATQWADAAHTLKGAAMSIGADQLAECCAAAESEGRGLPPSTAGAALLINDIRDVLAQTLEACGRASHALSRPGLRASKALNS